MLNLRYTVCIFLFIFVFGSCTKEKQVQLDRIMPGGSAPEKLFVLKLPKNIDWHQRSMLSCFQGLINRIDTRVYYVETEQDQFWLDYYKSEFGIDHEYVDGIRKLLAQFSAEIDGYIVYDPEYKHSINIATMIGSLENLLPVSTDQQKLLTEAGFKKVKEVGFYGNDRLEIYKKAMAELLPKCNPDMVAALCVHHPHWPTSTVLNRDYIMAHNIFSFDLSTSERDKADYNLVKEIYGNVDAGAIVIGWHCIRDKEHEAIGLASEFGHFGMCSLHTPNLTVHSSIPLPPGKKFSQRELKKENLNVENKVYIALMATDGDATWFMNDHVVNDWADPARGTIKYNWGFLPLAYDLMPGTIKYYIENCQKNDYFVAGPAGATYTYPYLHPDPSKFLEISNDYMDRCGLTTVHMTNWYDRDWWQEVELPEFHDKLIENIPSAIGYVRGMGESAFEESFLDKRKPYIFCGEGIHRGDDVYRVFRNFVDANDNRPLFIYSLVNHSIPIGEIKQALDRFEDDEIEAVHLDELLLLAQQAFDDGKITSELYPDKSGIKEILATEAMNSWPGFMEKLKALAEACNGTESYYENAIAKKPIGVEPIEAGDHLAFTTIWNSMTLVKLSLESKGIYVNHKPTAVSNFVMEYEEIEDVKVISELQSLWESWHRQNPTYEEAKVLTDRLYGLAARIDELME